MLGVDRSAIVAPGEPSEALLEDCCALSAHHHRGSGISAGLDSALDDALNGAEATAGHADIRWRLDRQAVARAGHRQCGEDDSKQL
jgi:hypothetical protein